MIQLPHTPSFNLTGKRALVTGASSGIGLALAAALAQAGAKVTVAARREDQLEDLVTALQAQGHSANYLVMDIANVEQTESQVEQHGPFDVLVNSAGLAIHGPAMDTQPADFDAVMNLNLRGAYFLTRAVAKGLIAEGKSGSLINVSSQMAHVGGIERAVYCASKHAVEGFTKTMAIEFGPYQVRVNTLCPTFIRTALTAATFSDPEKRAWVEGKIKLGRVGEVEDLMGAVVYLASDASSMVTGTAHLVDGGWTAD
jgi:NAD(P)-dependent dehydrogenase (short-subunit alcohol dehydrogenase family)|tara:strand:- start:180 stop:947 length:768 start_codon:yes stop_codon:yes gene_type:complete